jgi:hypothetical protein
MKAGSARAEPAAVHAWPQMISKTVMSNRIKLPI